MFEGIKNWLEVRIGLDDLKKEYITENRVSRKANYLSTLGFVVLIGIVVQVISGIFLLIYYVPHPDHAFMSVQNIMNKVHFGWLFRLIHVIGSNMIIAAVFLHVLDVFFFGDYKRPRELTWVGGGLLLIVTLTFGMSGNLLPWSQLSYWSTTIVTSMPTAFPIIGGYVSELLRGGDYISGITLNRFFALHVAILPFILLLLIGLHYFFISRTGLAGTSLTLSDEEEEVSDEFKKKTHPQGYPYYPDFFQKQVIMVLIYFSVMFFIMTFLPTLFLPADSTIPADPYSTPELIRPAWYFLAPYQALKLIPNKFLGITMLIIFTFIFLMWPFIDTKKEINEMKRPVLRGIFVFLIVLFFVLMYWGKY
jgi:ubiquinol-cytochrome c reductase cytochrome b subunit